jgi:hypothetical protein
MVNEVGFAIVWALPVRTSFQFHLEQAEVDPELQFIAAIKALDLSNLDRAGFVGPFVEETIQVEAHRRKQSSPPLLCQRAQD